MLSSTFLKKYDYFREKQDALNTWGLRLSRIVNDLELVKTEKEEA
jgi:hypothetical protein